MMAQNSSKVSELMLRERSTKACLIDVTGVENRFREQTI